MPLPSRPNISKFLQLLLLISSFPGSSSSHASLIPQVFCQNVSSRSETSVPHEVHVQGMTPLSGLCVLLRGKSVSCYRPTKPHGRGSATLSLGPLFCFLLVLCLCSEEHGLLFHRFISPFLPQNLCCFSLWNTLLPDTCLVLSSPSSALNPLAPAQWVLWPSCVPELPFLAFFLVFHVFHHLTL